MKTFHIFNQYSPPKTRKRIWGQIVYITEQQMYIFTSLTHTSLRMCNTGNRPDNRLHSVQEKKQQEWFYSSLSWPAANQNPELQTAAISCTQTSFLHHILLPGEDNRARFFSCKCFVNRVYSKGWSQWKETDQPGFPPIHCKQKQKL